MNNLVVSEINPIKQDKVGLNNPRTGGKIMLTNPTQIWRYYLGDKLRAKLSVQRRVRE
jgi:hypothetical protein